MKFLGSAVLAVSLASSANAVITITVANSAIDSSTATVTSSTIPAFNLTGGNALVVLVAGEGSTNAPTVTFDGNAVTDFVFVQEGAQSAAVFWVLGPSVSLGDVVVTWDAATRYAVSAVSLTDVGFVSDTGTFGEPDANLPWTENYLGFTGGLTVGTMSDNTFSNGAAPSIAGDNVGTYLQQIAGTSGSSAGFAQAFGGITGPDGTYAETFTKGGGTSGRNAGALVAFAVPEPSSMALLLGGLGFLSLRRRR